MTKKRVQNRVNNNVKKKKWILPTVIVGVVVLVMIFILLIGLIISVSSQYAGSDSSKRFGKANVVKIQLDGAITMGANSASVFGSSGTSSDWVVEQIKMANEDSLIKGIIFEINSPGGTVVASKEIVDAIKETKKPTASYIREVGASGAYWAASATDYIVADELSITGSIGVIGSYLNFGGLLENYNITYERLIAGHLKDAGSPYKEMTSEEKQIIQSKINIMYDYFVDDVSQNRNISREKMEEIATGMYYLGTEALELNLIDGYGGEDEGKDYISLRLGLESREQINVREYQRKVSFLNSLYGASVSISQSVGRGIASGLSESNNLKIRA